MSYIPEVKQIISNVTGNITTVVPANMYIVGIVVEGTNANAVTGGIKIGTTTGGTDVVTASPVPGNTLTHVSDSLITKRVFSRTVDTTLYIQAVTLFAGANINVCVMLREFSFS